MLVPIKWLKEYVDFGLDINEFADKMTLCGTIAEVVTYLGGDISGVVTAKIMTKELHPNADNLSVCKMSDGKNEYTVVTGAKNINVGDIVPLAKVGAKIHGDIVIKESDLRGVKSEGMMCSGQELSMSSSIIAKGMEDGIYIFSEEVPLGENALKYIGLDEYTIDFELTHNRADCNSILGIAYEAGAAVGKPFKMPDFKIDDKKNDIEKELSVEIKRPDLCVRYCARKLKVKEVKPSPIWMQQRLIASGIRPISNIVDVSNYVMVELGQPIHMFDYDKLEGGKIIVDTAQRSEKIVTLDNIERELDEEMLLINDANRGVCIAGVMGGKNSDIDDNTKNIVIESANFNKSSIRRTARNLGLRSEASAHYEKGINPIVSRIAIDRAAGLLIEIGACELIDGVIDVNYYEEKEKKIIVSTDYVRRFIGADISDEKMVECLNLLNLNPVLNEKDNTIEVTSPKLRDDINIKEDVVEEIARMYGYNNIPNTMLEECNYIAPKNKEYDNKNMIKDIIAGVGGFEILTYSFLQKERLDALNFGDDDIRSKYVKIINPLGEDSAYMRTSLVPCMLEALSGNKSRKNDSNLLFEIGNVYFDEYEDALPIQRENIIIGRYDSDFFELKGVLEYLFGKLRIDVKYVPSNEVFLHPGKSADIIINSGEKIGFIGDVHPLLLKEYGLDENTIISEISLSYLLNMYDEEKVYTPLAKYPSLERDIAVLVDKKVYAQEIKDVILESGGEYLVAANVFDVFEDAKLGENKKSVAFSLEFKANDRTLTDEEIDKSFDDIVKNVEDKLGGKLRG